MYTKKLTTTNFDGESVTEVLQFNLTEAELWAEELGGDSLGDKIKAITGDNPEEIDATKLSRKARGQILILFKDLMDHAYGIKSADGKRFVKNPQILEDFRSTQAYSDMFMLLIKDPEEGSRFIQQVLPNDFSKAASEYLEKHKAEEV